MKMEIFVWFPDILNLVIKSSQALKQFSRLSTLRSIRGNSLFAVNDVNGWRQTRNGDFTELIISIIMWDIYSYDCLQNQWINDLLVWIKFMRHFRQSNLAACHPLEEVIHHRTLHDLQFSDERCYKWEGFQHLYESKSEMQWFKLSQMQNIKKLNL